ncbi:MucR family transcriptional regulator [Ferrovibrio terrae]|uniref:MucR family transcriptional regulator n=1 Tax=Ferrovibrio terrae TaxID=2594003 RepID=A0A516H0C8_9PROT|nr:MucR family transcriptional regulator [Ferrovibrio terrae]QDO97224.1 MucR family transcriptional regulator [Ferrovibrio terrae]
MASPADRSELLALTAEIVAAHVSNNKLEAGDLPALIRQVYGTLAGIGAEPAELVAGGAADRPAPAVPVKKSVTPDYIVCLEDGKKLKMLKRHLMSHYKLTPEQYRERWSLPPEYPMVAPNYAIRRQVLAKKIGLGKGRRGG